jgi:osmoprotectant transport system substrate-binding protein
MRRHLLMTASTFTAAVLVLAGCGNAGSSGTSAPPSSASGAGCAGVAGSSLVVLTDDKHLQNTDNVVPAINKKASSDDLIAALNKVSSALDTTKLIELNKAVDIDRKSSKAAAQEFATANNITDGITKTGAGKTITVGAANFSENATLGQLYSIALTAAGYTVKVQQIGNRELYEPELEKGQIQVVPEYAATLATFISGKLDKNAADPSSSDLNTTMKNLTSLGEKVGLVFGTPSTAQDQNAFAVTKEFASKYQLTTLSDLATKCSGAATTLGGPAECPQRPKCQAGLVSTYNFQAGKFSTLDSGGPLTKTALKQGTVSVGLVFSSDGSLAAG